MANSVHMNLTLVDSAQAQKELTVNAALTRIDAILNTGAKDKDLATPPGSPAAGDVYIVAASPTGTWSGQAKAVAYYDQTWKFVTPNEGMTLWVSDEDILYSYNGTAWVTAGTGVRVLSAQNGGDSNSSASGSGSDYNHNLTYTIPANYLTTNKLLRVTVTLSVTTGAAAPTFTYGLKAGATDIARQVTTFTPGNNITGQNAGFSFLIQGSAAAGSSANVYTSPVMTSNGLANLATQGSAIAQPVALATNGTLVLTFASKWGSAGTGTNTVALNQFVVEALN